MWIIHQADIQVFATGGIGGVHRGKALTPFLLAEVSQRTGGASLCANLALLENNTRIAAHIAVTLTGSETHSEAK